LLPPVETTRATGFDIGFPNDFIRDMQSFVYGQAGALVDERKPAPH